MNLYLKKDNPFYTYKFYASKKKKKEEAVSMGNERLQQTKTKHLWKFNPLIQKIQKTVNTAYLLAR